MSSRASLMDVDSSMSNMQQANETTSKYQAPKEDNAKWFDLYPNRDLLDSSFEGYKLSLDTFSSYKLELNARCQLDTYNFIESSDSKLKFLLYQHLKLFGFQNLLIVNHFNDSNLYFFDVNRRLVKIVYSMPKLIPTRAIVPTNFQLPSYESANPERTYLSMRFFQESKAVIFDGYNNLFICENVDKIAPEEDQLRPENWEIQFKWQTSNNENTCILKDVVLFENNLHVMLVYVQEITTGSRANKFDTLVNWLTFELNENQWSLKRTRKMNCYSSVPEYLNFETNGQAINIAGPNYARFVYDSEIKVAPFKIDTVPRVESSTKTMDTTDISIGEKFYSWSQTPEEITVTVKLDVIDKDLTKINKNDVKVNIKPNSIEIAYVEKCVINDLIVSTIKAEESRWTLNEKSIELVLTKAKSGEMWPSLLRDQDQLGEFLCSENGHAQIGKMPETPKTLFSLDDQLEECDGVPLDDQMLTDSDENYLMLRRLHGNSHECTHKSYLNNNKFLFETRLNPSKSAALCLRQDVDGILWQPHKLSVDSDVWLTHEHTFLAFGYVQASKQETKFRLAAPNCSYVCTVDMKKHVYIYKQEGEKVETELRNRKTGKVLSHVAKQFLISLETDNEIYGAYAANDFLVILLRDMCCIYKINSKNAK